MSRQIPLHVSHRKAYVWSVDDIATLRSEYRICGTLAGTLPSISQQNVFLGVPLTLIPEEVAMLVDEGIAYIVDDPTSHTQPTQAQLEAWAEARKISIAAELEERNAATRATTRVDTSDGAQKKREARRAARQQENTDESLIEVPDNLSRTSVQQLPHTVHVPTLSSDLVWFSPKIYRTIADAREAGVWVYPSTINERAECAVFRGLWRQGNYLGPGIKFGGNYLVYPGDPLRFHSHFVASVHPTPTSLIRPMDIVAFGRLGTATKKVHLLCGYDDETGAVSYFSIEWASFG